MGKNTARKISTAEVRTILCQSFCCPQKKFGSRVGHHILAWCKPGPPNSWKKGAPVDDETASYREGNSRSGQITIAPAGISDSSYNDRFAPWEIGSFPKRNWNGIGCGWTRSPQDERTDGLPNLLLGRDSLEPSNKLSTPQSWLNEYPTVPAKSAWQVVRLRQA